MLTPETAFEITACGTYRGRAVTIMSAQLFDSESAVRVGWPASRIAMACEVGLGTQAWRTSQVTVLPGVLDARTVIVESSQSR